MIKTLALVSAFALSTPLSLAAQDVVHAVDGTVKKVDAGTKTIVVDAKDGTEHTFHYASDVTVDGAKDTKKGAVDAAHGVEEAAKLPCTIQWWAARKRHTRSTTSVTMD